MSFLADHPTVRSLIYAGVPECDPEHLCPCCSEYAGEYRFEIDGEWVCVQCFEDWWGEMSNEERAQMMGVRVRYEG